MIASGLESPNCQSHIRLLKIPTALTTAISMTFSSLKLLIFSQDTNIFE